MLARRITLPLAACALLASFATAQTTSARHVSAPAADIERGSVRLPDPAESATATRALLRRVNFEREGANLWVARLEVPLERDGGFALALLGPSAASWRVFGAPIGRAPIPLDAAFATERRVGFLGDALPGWVVDRRDVRGTRAGPWTLRIESDAEHAHDAGWLLVSAGADIRASAHLSTFQLVAGQPIAIVARADGGDLGTLVQAEAEVEFGGLLRGLELHDDGLHADGAALDGVFGAWLPDDVAGTVRARVELSGLTRDRRRFARAVPLSFEVHEPRVEFSGALRASELDGGVIEFGLGVTGSAVGERVLFAAELWGRDALGHPVPICWLARIQEPALGGVGPELRLRLDPRWFEYSGAGGDLELRNVRAQDPDSFAVLASWERADVPFRAPRASGPLPAPAASNTSPGWAALGGGGGQLPATQSVQLAPFYPALMLVHGYCSSGSIWPAADFTQPKLEFLDPNANRTHDQFAQLLWQRAQSAGLASFGVVAHSQGGPAALHLLTYYTSALDFASGGRRIQSLASPYLGTPLASLGAFACGTNNNMTPSGAAAWLAGIPTWARAEVYTWTTANSGAACNFLTGLLLADPEDGTVEKTRSELPGGNNMGHTVGWCHTTGMTNPASYTDHARNQAMNAAAAR